MLSTVVAVTFAVVVVLFITSWAVSAAGILGGSMIFLATALALAGMLS